MSSIIVVFPKKEIATNIRNILVRNGFDAFDRIAGEMQ